MIDFGAARNISESDTFVNVCGSLCYACPESLRGEEYSGMKQDVWSLGILLHVLLDSRVPFKTTDLILSSQIAELPPLHTKRSPVCVDLLNKLLEFDPLKRPDAAEILNHPWLRSMIG